VVAQRIPGRSQGPDDRPTGQPGSGRGDDQQALALGEHPHDQRLSGPAGGRDRLRRRPRRGVRCPRRTTRFSGSYSRPGASCCWTRQQGERHREPPGPRNAEQCSAALPRSGATLPEVPPPAAESNTVRGNHPCRTHATTPTTPHNLASPSAGHQNSKAAEVRAGCRPAVGTARRLHIYDREATDRNPNGASRVFALPEDWPGWCNMRVPNPSQADPCQNKETLTKCNAKHRILGTHHRMSSVPTSDTMNSASSGTSHVRFDGTKADRGFPPCLLHHRAPSRSLAPTNGRRDCSDRRKAPTP
jgi:hypothetical protein